ncbi:hypothetical protein [Actinomadura madurae]|uniref:hypothetical protein n=1 Tax=Actinomadura madurae TaxID=1993 RepID=UPI0020D211E9|nr:hypothetical protein [Actinomadura madurae]MCP9977985.1 hypothetical protein [Actinomadura madurae]
MYEAALTGYSSERFIAAGVRGSALVGLGWLAAGDGDTRRARELFAEALDMALDHPIFAYRGAAAVGLAGAAAADGDGERAARLLGAGRVLRGVAVARRSRRRARRVRGPRAARRPRLREGLRRGGRAPPRPGRRAARPPLTGRRRTGSRSGGSRTGPLFRGVWGVVPPQETGPVSGRCADGQRRPRPWRAWTPRPANGAPSRSACSSRSCRTSTSPR